MKKRIAIGVILILSIMGVLFSINLYKNLVKEPNKDIANALDLNTLPKVNNIYRSERGLGNDRYDIYQFELGDVEEITSGEKIDDKYWQESKRFKELFSKEKENMTDGDILERNLKNLEQKVDTIYVYKDSSESKDTETNYKLYLYNIDLNQGYYIDFAI